MTNCILVALDSDIDAQGATKYALHFAEKSGASLTDLIHHLAEHFLKVHDFTRISKMILPEKNPGERLLKHQKEVLADPFLLSAFPVLATKRLAFGSTTHHLIANSTYLYL